MGALEVQCLDRHGHISGPAHNLEVKVKLDCPCLTVPAQVFEVDANGRAQIIGGE